MDYKRYCAGAFSGLIEVFTTQPLDVYKTNKQYYKNFSFSSNSISLLDGLKTKLIGIIPNRTLFWVSQDYFKSKIPQYQWGLNYGLAGCAAGSVQTILDQIMEINKNQSIISKQSDMQSLCTIINSGKLFHGFRPLLYRNAGFCGIFTYIVNNYKTGNTWNDFQLAGAAGVVASVATHPYDYVKTQIHGNLSDTRSTLTVLRSSHPKELMTGMGLRTATGLITMSIGYTIYNKFIHWLD